MPQTHAENRRRRAEPPYDLGGDASFVRRARTGRDDDVAGRQRSDFAECHLVAAPHHDVPAQLTDIASEVVDERIAVVDDENHVPAATASISARALSSVSRYSCSGPESATIPPPALKYMRPSRTTAVRMAMLVSRSPVTLQ